MTGRSRGYLIPLGAFLAMFAVLCAVTRGFAHTDTFELLDGTAVAIRCLDKGVHSGCGFPVAQFALLQYLPAFVFHQTGFSYIGALNGLVAVNWLSALGCAGLVVWCARRFAGTATAATAGAVMLAGPFVWYAHAGFGEAFAALTVTAFVAVLLLRGPPAALGAAMFLAGISKETAVPFLLALALAVWLIRDRDFRRGEYAAIVIGGLLALGVNAEFNVFRYDTVRNLRYTPAIYRASLPNAANNLAAQFFSPTAGLFWMWPSFLAVVVAATGFGLRRRRLLEPGVVLGATFLVLLAFFSARFAPFGGVGWGPRLLIPWAPALLIVAIAAYGTQFRAATARLFRAGTATVALAAALLLLTGLPHLIAAVDSSDYAHNPPGLRADRRELVIRNYAPDDLCPTLPLIEVSRGYWYRCLHHDLWNRGLLPAIAYEKLDRTRVLVFALAWCAAMLGLLGFARAAVRDQPPARA